MGVGQHGGRRWIVATVLAVVVGIVGFGVVEPGAPEGEAGAVVPGAVTDPAVPIRIAYGSEADDFGELYLPSGPLSGSARKTPVVVLIHGGGWIQTRDLTQFSAQARQLAESGVAVWNIEYRRVNGAGGWPLTLTDVATAVGALATVVQERAGGRLDLERVYVAGHSAGGQLAAWVTGRRTTQGYAAPHIRGLTLMAAVLDLDYAVARGHDRFAQKLLGGLPDEVPDRYEFASPIDNIPVGVRIDAVHGSADQVVSPEQSRRYIRAVHRAGAPGRLHMLPGTGHADFADPNSPAWVVTRTAILAQVASSA